METVECVSHERALMKNMKARLEFVRDELTAHGYLAEADKAQEMIEDIQLFYL